MFAVGDDYESYMGRWSRLLAPLYARFAGVEEGERILDVGTGTGALAANLPACEITGIDPSSAFVAHAAKSIRSARFEVGDAQALRFGDASFDRAMTMLVLNFIPDHEKALAEMRRVTRAGGGVSACVWDYGEGMESLRIFWDEVVAFDAAAAPKHERNMKLTRAGQLGELWRKAGLREVREEPIVIDQAFASFADYWDPFLKGIGPGGAYVASLPEGRRSELEKRLRRNCPDGAFTFQARAWCVRGMN